MKKNKKTNLGKRIHLYESLQDMEKQFMNDVETASKYFTSVVDEKFDIKNPYDQSVLSAILTNMVAYVEIHAELDGVNMESILKENYEESLKMYRKQVYGSK